MSQSAKTSGMPSPDDQGVGGESAREPFEATIEALEDPHRARGAMREIRTALKHNRIAPWDIPGHAARRVPERLMEIVERQAQPGASHESVDRAATSAAKTLTAMREYNLRVAVEVDRSDRLDTGEETEIVGVRTAETASTRELGIAMRAAGTTRAAPADQA